MVEFSEVLRRRRMVRNYDERAVPGPARDRLLAAAQRAPSAGFTQGWGFLVLESAADRERFWSATVDPGRTSGRWLVGMRRAPLLIVCFSDRDAYLRRYAEPDKRRTAEAGSGDGPDWPVPYWDIDTGFAALLMLLDAVDQGLGACFFGVPGRRVGAVRSAFGAPDTVTPVGVVSVGYPAPDHRSASRDRGRRDGDEVIHIGRW